jgi:hypothetical protein
MGTHGFHAASLPVVLCSVAAILFMADLIPVEGVITYLGLLFAIYAVYKFHTRRDATDKKRC